MTWDDYRPIPGINWPTSGAVPTKRALRVALVAVDFPDQPFVITQPKGSDPFGNPQIDPVSRDQVPKFYADFFNTPSPVNHFQTINGYWMEQSGGTVGVSSVTAFGSYRQCDGGGARSGRSDYTIENVQRIGYGSFQPDNGVLIAKNKPFPPGGRSTEGDTCGYNCFTWVEDAHPEDIDMVDYNRPDGTPVKRTIGDHRQLNDALFHAGTNSGSTNEYVDAANSLHFYVLGVYTDAKGLRHYIIGVQNPAGAGPQTRGVTVADGTRAGKSANCLFPLTNSGVDAPTDPALHPQDERAFLRGDIYRLSVSAQGAGWSARLSNNLSTAAFGQTVKVPAQVSPGSARIGHVRLTATSVSDPTKTASATCALGG